MTDAEQKLCAKLVASSALASDKDGEIYSECCLLLRGSYDSDVLREMFKAFSDVEASGLQYELIAACESFPFDVYITTFIEEGIALYYRSPFWFRSMFITVLNSSDFQSITLAALDKAGADARLFYLDRVHEYYKKNLMSPDDAKLWVGLLEPKPSKPNSATPLAKTGSGPR
jgi:hypothetical protein